MKNVLYYFAIVSALLMLFGCIREQNTEDNPFEVTFNASFEDATKTSYETGGKVNWVEGDLIRYYTLKDGPVNEYEVVRSGHSIQMVANVPDNAQVIIAQYGGTGLSDKSVKGFTLDGVVKAEQSGKFEDAHVSVAKSFDLTTGASLTFRNITSLMKFSFTRHDVAYIVFTASGGEKIQGDGRLNISFSDTEPSASFGDAGGSSIKVNIGGAGTFFLSTLPVKLSRGFVIEYFDTANLSIGKTVVESPVTSTRNQILNLGTLDERIAEPDPEPEAIDLGLPSGIKWASFNVGATKVGDYGNHFSWGETVPTNLPSWSTYKWSNGSYSAITKYNTVDNKTVLDPEDDAARVNWGGSWRMPTEAEWKELNDNCTWTWTIDYNGTGIIGMVGTSKIKGYTDKSIFIPAAGMRNEVNHLYYEEGTYGFYWSSSLDISNPSTAFYYGFYSSVGYCGSIQRISGYSVRPVNDEKIYPESITLSKTTLSLCIGDSERLVATVMPINAADKTVSWYSDNSDVATVDADGNVNAIAIGSASIMVTTNDGNKTTTCIVKVVNPTLTEVGEKATAVDLGLSVKWATFNIGATKPEEYGDYYAWGETEPKDDYGWSTYKYANGDEKRLTKYCSENLSGSWDGFGEPDGLKKLEYNDDAARVIWGGRWQMPTDMEMKELKNNCSWKWTNNYNETGIAGMIATSKINGYTDKSVFFPSGNYWSSSLDTDHPYCAWSLGLFQGFEVIITRGTRCSGYTIRPVCPK